MKGRILKRFQKGQSLVEMAFALPVLLLLMVGIVELGYALNAYVQTVNAAREGARFGSMGGRNNDITSIVQGATSGLIQYNDVADVGNSDLYIAHVEISEDCTVVDFDQEQTMDTPDFETIGVTQDEILAWLSEHGYSYCGLSFVAVDLHYRSPSLLRLPLVRQLSEAVPMRSLTLMRKETPRPLSGHCDAYPIAAYEGVFYGLQPGDELADVWIGGDDGNWGWLRWRCDTNDGNPRGPEDPESLCNYLTPPANSDDYENPDNCEDHWLAIGKKAWGNSGVSNADCIRQALDGLVGRIIRIIVWDYTDWDPGVGLEYHVVNFALVKIISYDLPPGGQGAFITAEFVGFDATGCE